MEELIKRLERVIATGAPDKDGMHPISAETVLEVVRGLSALSTNLASLDTDCISRQQAIEALSEYGNGRAVYISVKEAVRRIEQLPTIQPEPHTGHWEPVGVAEAVGGESAMWGSAIAYHVCSECWEQALEENGEEKLSDFCPHCGADMRGEQDG